MASRAKECEDVFRSLERKGGIFNGARGYLKFLQIIGSDFGAISTGFYICQG